MFRGLLFLWLCLIPEAMAQTVEEILAKHIEALGGSEKINAVKTVIMTGRNVRGRGNDAPFTRKIKLPNKVHNKMEMRGRTVIQAFDGKTTWGIMPSRGGTEPQKMEGRRGGGIRNQTQIFGPLVNAEKRGWQVALAGKEDFEGTEVYKLTLTGKDDRKISCYVDAEYFVELKRVVPRTDRNGNQIERATLFSDYKEVAGVMIPHAIKTLGGAGGSGRGGRRGGGEILIEKIEINVEIDDSIFAMPPKTNP